MKLMKYILITLLLVFNCSGVEAAFESITDNNVAPLSIGTVKSYGRYTVREDLFATLKDYLHEGLQNSTKFKLAEDYSGSVTIKGQNVSAESFFDVLLLDAIVRGKNYKHAEAGATLLNFAKAKGIVEGKNKSQVYSLSEEYLKYLNVLRANNQGKYIVLCNLIGAYIEDCYSGKIHVCIDFYLIDAEKNLVYEGRVYKKKSTTSVSGFMLFAKINNKDSTQVLQEVFEIIAKNIAEEIETKGLKALNGKG